MNKFCFYFFIISLFCNSQNKRIGDGILNLNHVNFKLSINTLLPIKYKDKKNVEFYKIPSKYSEQLFVKDTIFQNAENMELKIPISIEYKQKDSNTIDTLAIFENHIFNKINISTTLDHNIMIFNGVNQKISVEDSEKFIKLLTVKYGKPKIFQSKWEAKNQIHEWNLKGKIVRYTTEYNNVIKTKKLVKGKNQDEKGIFYSTYLYLINPIYKNKIFDKIKLGEFIFLD